MVAGTDLVRATTSDAAGAFSVEVEAAVGDTIDIRATGPTVPGEPDEAGLRHQPDPDRGRRRHDRVAAPRAGRRRARPGDREPGLRGDGHAGPAELDPSVQPDTAGDGSRLRRRRGDAGGTTVPGGGRARLRAGGDRDGGGVALEVGPPLTDPVSPGSAGVTGISRCHRDQPAPSTQPAPRVTRRTRRSSSSSTRCARRPASMRPRSPASEQRRRGSTTPRRRRDGSDVPSADEIPHRRVERDHRPRQRLGSLERAPPAARRPRRARRCGRPAVAHARERQPVADQQQPVGGLGARDDRPQRSGGRAARRRSARRRPRRRSARRPRGPAPGGRRRVIALNRWVVDAAAGDVPGPGLVERRGRMAQRRHDAERGEPLDERERARQLRARSS